MAKGIRKAAARSVVSGFMVLALMLVLPAHANPPALPVAAVLDLAQFDRQAEFGSISSDGDKIAFTIHSCRPLSAGNSQSFYDGRGLRASASGCSDIWVSDRVGNARSITRGSRFEGVAETPSWAPRREMLAFFGADDGQARLWAWYPAGNRFVPLSDRAVRPSFFGARVPIRWLPTGEALIAPTIPAEVPATGVEDPFVDVFASTQSASTGSGRAFTVREEVSDLARVATVSLTLFPIGGTEARDLVRSRPVFWYDLSPDGRRLAYSFMTGFDEQSWARRFAIEILDLATGAVIGRADDIYPDQGVASWSPDGTRLAFLTDTGDRNVARVSVLDIGTMSILSFHGDGDPSPPTYRGQLFPIWERQCNCLVFSAHGSVWRARMDDRTIRELTPPDWPYYALDVAPLARNRSAIADSFLVRARHRNSHREAVFRLGSTARSIQLLRALDGAVTGLLVSPRANGGIFLRLEAQRVSPDLWWADSGFATMKQITRLNPNIDARMLGTFRPFSFQSGGESRSGRILLPANHVEGRRAPTIVVIYPRNRRGTTAPAMIEEFSLSENFFNNMQLLASRGYAVLFPDINQGTGDPISAIAGQVDAAVDQAIASGVADPDRLGIMGYSYGGYSVLGVLTRSRRFKAAVVGGAFSSLPSLYGVMQANGLPSWQSWMEVDAGGMGGSLWQQRGRYIDNSPLFSLDRVETPLLMFHGAEDSHVPVNNGDETFLGLSRLGKTVEYRRYRGEDHGFRGRREIGDFWQSTLRWFETYVAGCSSCSVSTPSVTR